MMSERSNNCVEVRAFLVDRAVGQADDVGAKSVRQHLAACPACCLYASQLVDTVRRLDAAPSICPSDEFDYKLHLRLKREQRLEQSWQGAVLAMVAAGLRRLRQFQMGAAVYPLVALSVAYVLWTTLTREPQLQLSASSYSGRPGILRLWEATERGEVQQALLQMEAFAANEIGWVAKVPGNPYQPEDVPEPPVLTRYVTLPEMGHEILWEAPEVPRDWQQLARLPDPPIVPLPAKVVEGISGYTLARARFATVRNANPLLSGAISRGIFWLCRNQAPNGYWQANEAEPTSYSRSEVTAAAALALMQSGFSPSAGDKPSQHLKRALTWLVRQKRDDGFFAAPGPRQLHAQALTIVALSEALRLTDREACSGRFLPLVSEAVAALVGRQAPAGGWGNAELTAMALAAISSARAVGVPVEKISTDAAIAWLAAHRERRSSEVLASIESRHATPEDDLAYAVIGEVLCTEEALWQLPARAEIAMTGLAQAPVIWGSGNFFRWYGATLAAYRLGGRFWQEWRAKLLVELISHQDGWARGAEKSGTAGSWEAHGLCRPAGRAYSTAMVILTLTATCGHSPLYGSVK